jgi:cardiolipin synthase
MGPVVKETGIEPSRETEFQWLRTGGEALAEMLAAVAAARRSVRLEMYMFDPSPMAAHFRDALGDACRRGASVQVLIDAFGSMSLPDGYWETLRAAGAQVRRFNPNGLKRFGIRDHRKILVCDDDLAFIGGANIAAEYHGDGVASGWRDLGLRIRGPLAAELAAASDEMFAEANFRHKPFSRLRKSFRQRTVPFAGGKILLTGPGRNNPIKLSLSHDLKHAGQVAIICAYFLPPSRILRQLARLARRGVKVQLILPGKSDVLLSRLAAQSFYRRLLLAGVEIYEYQPQILHAKMFLIDDIVYVGSSNLDSRSLNINYELMLRVPGPRLACEGREIFAGIKTHSRRIELEPWRRSRNFVDRIKGRLARWVLAHLDPYIAKQSS